MAARRHDRAASKGWRLNLKTTDQRWPEMGLKANRTPMVKADLKADKSKTATLKVAVIAARPQDCQVANEKYSAHTSLHASLQANARIRRPQSFLVAVITEPGWRISAAVMLPLSSATKCRLTTWACFNVKSPLSDGTRS